MKRKHIIIAAVSLILALALAIGIVGCSTQEESPADEKDTAADDYFDTTDTIVAVEITDEDGNTVTTIFSNKPTEPTEGSSDTSDEAGSASSTTSNGTNLPTVTSTQTTKPATTTYPSGNSPAVTTRPSTSPSTTTAPVVTTAPAPAVTTAPKPSVTTSPEPIVTTTPQPPVVTQPPVTTTPQPPVTTTPAPVPGHTHSYSSKVTKEPTCTATGTRTYTCSCGDKYTESIPAKGHDWHTETIHHDAVIGTRNVTETWVRETGIVWIALTQKGIDAGLGSKEYPNYYKVIAYIGYGKLGDNGKIIQNTIIWEYLYSDENNSVVDVVRDYGGDFLKKGYGDGTYNSTRDYEYEEKVVGTESYVITPAYDETVTTCTVCGAHK